MRVVHIDACSCEKIDIYKFFCDQRYDYAVTLEVTSDAQIAKGGRKSYQVKLEDEIKLNEKAKTAFETSTSLWIQEVQSTCNLHLQKGVKYIVRGKINRKGIATTNFCQTMKWSSLSEERHNEVKRLILDGLRCK
ncbi:hypothetical protein B4U80_14000 [Leptotrombidium deliense]|uniref:NTR domain-containing protein n=1 Tax=Leptotrombidium deliense TaxID=299467 RepID=A0A443S5H6_9ACAR|nr:hypothetical protein B4U80_14000 [Leptotrombidium deliense]